MKRFALCHLANIFPLGTVLVASSFASPVSAHNDALQQQSEYEIGVMVKAIDKAITTPQSDSLKLIYQYGTDSRYYVMIRGWLVQELTGAQSQLESHRQQDERRQQLEHKVSFLKQAIRRIDLE